MTCVFPSVTDGHLSSEKPYPATRFDLGIRLPRKTPPDYMADTLNRILKTLESITDIRTAVKKSGWIYPGGSLLIAHGVSKFTRKTEVRCGSIDFAYAHEHNNELPPNEVDDGLGTSPKMLKYGQLLAALSPLGQ